MTVRNLTSYKLPSCGCGTYREHWEKGTELTFNTCSKFNCNNRALVGAHVINCHGISTGVRQIIPLCNMCNSIPTSGFYNLRTGIRSVAVNNTKNC